MGSDGVSRQEWRRERWVVLTQMIIIILLRAQMIIIIVQMAQIIIIVLVAGMIIIILLRKGTPNHPRPQNYFRLPWLVQM